MKLINQKTSAFEKAAIDSGEIGLQAGFSQPKNPGWIFVYLLKTLTLKIMEKFVKIYEREL